MLLQQLAEGRKRKRMDGDLEVVREHWKVPAEYPTLMLHELEALAPVTDPNIVVPIQFPTSLELEVIPAPYAGICVPILKEQPWLIPAADGLWCRCCSDKGSVGDFSG